MIVLAVLWSGIRRLEFGSLASTALSMLELLGIGLSVVGLGWVGLRLFGGTNVVALLIWCVGLASRKQAKLTYASTLSGESTEAMHELAERLCSRTELRNYGPIAIADLIVLLANRIALPSRSSRWP